MFHCFPECNWWHEHLWFYHHHTECTYTTNARNPFLFFQTNFFKAKNIHKQETRGMSKNRWPLQYFIFWILTHVPPIEIVIFHMTNPTEWRNQVDPAECLWGWAFQGLHLPKLSPWETGCVNVWYMDTCTCICICIYTCVYINIADMYIVIKKNIMFVWYYL